MAKGGFHRASEGQDARSERPARWYGQPRPTQRVASRSPIPKARPYHVPRSQSASRPICSGVSSGSEPSAALPKLGIRSFVSP
jgi:hypothetical protein